MGYACPVCETPQSDAVHLANHLGFTALARGGEHETWLDDHVPDWGSLDDETLAERVVDHAEETAFPQVFEDTTDQHRDHGGPTHDNGDHDHHTEPESQVPGTTESLEAARNRAAAGADIDEADLQAIIEEATALTRQRQEESETE